MGKRFLLIGILTTFLIATNAQAPFLSESLIKYDLATHKTDKPIPFDHPFTLVLEKFKGGDVINVHLYEAHMVNGNRFLVYNVPKTAHNNHNGCCTIYKGQNIKDGDISAIKDKALNFKSDTGSLMIFVDPLKPNKLFDFNIISQLSPANKALLYQVNVLLSKGETAKAHSAFDQFDEALTDPFIHRSYLNLEFSDYQTFFNDRLSSAYRFFSTMANFPFTDSLRLNELQAVVICSNKEKEDFKDAHYLVEVIQHNYNKGLQLGLVDISKGYKKKDTTELAFGHTRLQYLQSNLLFIDSLQQRIGGLIAKGYGKVIVGTDTVNLEHVRSKVASIHDRITGNIQQLLEKVETVSITIDNNKGIKQGTYLAGNTVSSDLKTAGGSVLFIDAGFTNITAPGLKGSHAFIPRLYSGVSIYFRPIDKNTRRNSFPKKFNPAKNCGCDSNGECGPDYGVITKASIWQHLCLNVGITLGTIPNKDFENFYNNTSLLVGPAYRFKRAFKISAGFAFLKRTSENPLVSERKVVVGEYASLSVDIDFIQSIKDITSILFK